jgi:hypothetical protein
MEHNVTIYEPEDVIYVMAEGGNVRVYEVQEDGSLVEVEPVVR